MLTTFSCIIDTTDSSAALGLEIWFDNKCIIDCAHVKEPLNISYDFKDDGGEHKIQFIMKNKTELHTKIDAQGNILNDASLTISSVAFDEIKLGHIFVETTEYQHNFNGTQNTVTQPFYGIMGCNGTVIFKFTSPIYPWLLERS